jgi:hypothetical protein
MNTMERIGVKIVVITAPALPTQGELQPREQLKPSFADGPYIDAEVLSTNTPEKP